jgi:uncharacterized membrane protein
MSKLATFGRYLFGAGLMASGLQQVVTGEFVRLVSKLSPWVPWPSFWAYAVGAMLVVLGGAILFGRKAPEAAAVVAVLTLALFLVQKVAEIASNPWAGFMWTNPAKVLALCGGAILLAGSRPLRPLGPALLAAFLTICGIQHYVYADFVTTLVPAWMPALRFWTYFTGTALIAGGLGLLVPRTRVLAATLSGLMVFLWVWLVHIPRAVELRNASEVSGIFEALAICGVALLVASLGPKPATVDGILKTQ